MTVKQVSLLAMLVSLTVVLEQVLAFLPSIQLTTLLIVVISTNFKKPLVSLAIIAYVTLDNILGGFTILYPFMLISWLGFGLIINCLRNKNELILAIVSLVFGLVHMIILGIASIYFYKLNALAYILSDIAFTAVFMLVNFLTVMWLYQPLDKIIKEYI